MLTLSREVYDTLVSHARRERPEEVCGILGGTAGEHARAVEIHRTENVADDPRSAYAIDPEEQLSVMEELESRELDVVGFYHSHPAGPDGLSATDADEATWEGHSYVLVSLYGAYPFVGSWRFTGESFEPEAVRLD